MGNKIPLYVRREDIFHFIAERYPEKSFSGPELICLYAWPWWSEEQLGNTILDMRYRRTDKTSPPAPVREEELQKIDSLIRTFVDSSSPQEFLDLNFGFLCDLLHIKNYPDHKNQDSPTWYAGYDSRRFYVQKIADSKLSASPRFEFLRIVPRCDEQVILRCGEPFAPDVISRFLENVYGRVSLRNDESILDSEPFGENALDTVLQNIAEHEEYIELARSDKNGDTQHLLELMSQYKAFLDICKRICERRFATTDREETSAITNGELPPFLDGRDEIMAFLGASWNTCKDLMAEHGIARPSRGKWQLPWPVAVKIKIALKK